MSQQKRSPEIIKEIESKVLDFDTLDEDAACGNESHSKHLDGQDDLLNFKESICSVLGLNSTIVRNILQATRRNNALTTKAIIQSLGLSKFKAEILKSIIDVSMNYSEYHRVDNAIREIQGNDNQRFASTRYDNYDRVQNMLADFQRILNNGDVGNDTSCGLNSLLRVLHTYKETKQDSSRGLEAAPDGDGDGDENSKLIIDSIPLGRSSRYLMTLENKASREIHGEVPTKENYLLRFSKLMFDKLSWCEKCEEVYSVNKFLVCFIFLHFRTTSISPHVKVREWY